MKTSTIRCRDFMVGDWVANRNGSPMQIVAVDEDNAYACEGNEERPCIFGDYEGYELQPIEITRELLEANGFIYKNEYENIFRFIYGNNCNTSPCLITIRCKEEFGTLNIIYIECISRNYNKKDNHIILWDNFFVHTLQHALRLIGLSDIADNFKV